MKKWTIGKPDPKAAEILSGQGGLPRICADILVSRGIDTIEKAAEFFNQQNGEETLSDPFLIKDMREAAETLLAAVDEGKRICIYGDYDCDGITATAVLYSYLECIGGNVEYYINDRSEGYGLCSDAVKRLAESGVELIVTVDNGISAVNEAKLISELGMELVITDHHQPPDILPEAAAVVDPHRSDDLSPFKDLCGCGVALKLIAAMDGGDYSSALEQFSDLAAIATIADIVPLKGENREIVMRGLHYLENTENVGLQALINVSGLRHPVSSTEALFDFFKSNVSVLHNIVEHCSADGIGVHTKFKQNKGDCERVSNIRLARGAYLICMSFGCKFICGNNFAQIVLLFVVKNFLNKRVYGIYGFRFVYHNDFRVRKKRTSPFF